MIWNSASTHNQENQTGSSKTGPDEHRHRPKLGIAFGSGAARGWAHIGVIQRLAEAGIVPDVVSGTSIGALVGGCDAAGKLEELTEFALSLTKRRVFGLIDITWRGGGGLIGGDRLTDLLNDHLGDQQIEDLDRPFVCIATELATGHELWLKTGPLIAAMRASYALPGVFQPVYFSHQWLIDGAVVNPIPVSVCRALGARVVLAVNLNTDDFGAGTVIQTPAHRHVPTFEDGEKLPESGGLATSIFPAFGNNEPEPPGITAVLVSAFNISQDRLARSRMAGDPPDIVIAPRAADIGLFDFDRAADSIALGREAVENLLPNIERIVEAYSTIDSDED